jgi:hypothetical protein
LDWRMAEGVVGVFIENWKEIKVQIMFKEEN